MTRKVSPPAPLDCWDELKSLEDLMRQWMNCLFWSIVRWEGGEWVSEGRTTETREEALDEAEAVCSVRTVVLWAIQALHYTISRCIEEGN